MSKLISFALGCTAALVASFGMNVQAADGEAAKTESAAPAAKNALPDIPVAGLPKVWLQGAPITKWEKDTVYIFEFWATWCGPCIKAMPHMEKLHQSVKDKPGFRIVGVNVYDHNQTPDELKKFLSKRETKLNYAFAADLDGQTTEAHWLKPQKVNGIPEAFAIKNGKLIWRGHPTLLTEEVLLAMGRPDFDSEAFKKQAPDPRRDRSRFMREFKTVQKLIEEKGWQAASAHIRGLEKEGTVKGDYLTELNLELYKSLDRLNKPEEAQKVLGLLAKSFPTNYRMQYSLADIMLKSGRGDAVAVAKCLDQALAAAGKNPFLLSPVWTLKSRLAETQGNIPEALKAIENAIATTNLGEMTATILKKTGDKESLMDVVGRVAAGIQPEPPHQPLPIENTVEDKRFTPLFEKLSWLNHSGLKGLPKDKSVFIGIWRAYMNGNRLTSDDGGPSRTLDLVLKKYGLMNHPEVRALVLSLYPVAKEDIAKQGGKAPGSPYPVGVTSDDSLLRFAMEMKLDSFPAAVLVRNGEVLWAGEIRRIPAWVVAEAKGGLPGTFEERKAAREAENAKMKDHMKKVSHLRSEQKAEEYYALLEEGMKDYGQYPWYAGMVAEAKSGKYFVAKDYASAVKVIDEMVASFPMDETTASYAMKIYTCAPGMTDNSYEARRRALQIMHDANTRGSDVYNSACYEEMCRMAMERQDYATAKKDAEKAFADMNLVKKYAELKKK